MEIKGMYMVTYERYGIEHRALITEPYDAEAFAKLTDGEINIMLWDVEVKLPT